jgi:hypothetical protein
VHKTHVTARVNVGLNNNNEGAGFTAIAGWDPVTGAGSPNFETLSKLSDWVGVQ